MFSRLKGLLSGPQVPDASKTTTAAPGPAPEPAPKPAPPPGPEKVKHAKFFCDLVNFLSFHIV